MSLLSHHRVLNSDSYRRRAACGAIAKNYSYLRVVYVDIHMQQSISTISFLHIRTSACVRMSLSVLEFRESVTSRKILCKFQEIRGNSVFVFGCLD